LRISVELRKQAKQQHDVKICEVVAAQTQQRKVSWMSAREGERKSLKEICSTMWFANRDEDNEREKDERARQR
jgi:proteasome lid subunit RPN8/RPN11